MEAGRCRENENTRDSDYGLYRKKYIIIIIKHNMHALSEKPHQCENQNIYHKVEVLRKFHCHSHSVSCQ